jgi:hypothetical protein
MLAQVEKFFSGFQKPSEALGMIHAVFENYRI